ncbi:hypothetical protein P3T76_011208 [Phytophthora citrophthora]|uniref:M96 mating-specific protein family n=1 Tax=Phytophthora citrophthora TaxID=4793 RepID=A0AAD9LGM1_9STRA|nr:hypothetical protein P3T76_011208 [Phytophthora citrophthora]
MEECIAVREDRSVRATPYTRCQGRLRKRPNHELEYLREKVAHLEQELAVLRQPDSGVVSSMELDNGDTWKSLAAKQNELANAVLVDNVKLRTMLEGQLHVAQTLENAIDQHWKNLSQGRRWFTGEGRRPRASSLSDELLYALLEEDTASQYAAVDQVLGASAVVPKHCDFIPKLRIEQGADGVSFHHQELRLLPFAISNVVNALHNSLSHGDAGRPLMRVRKLWKSENYAQATTSVKLNLPNSRQAEVKARLVQRVFPEATRHVFIWSAYVEIEGSTFVRLEEKGWITLKPYQFKTKGSTTGSKLHSVVRVTPLLQFISEEDETLHVGEMTDLVVDTYNRNFSLLYQVLENLMLDTAMNE